MANYAYGSVGRAEQELAVAKLTQDLIIEAIRERLSSEQITVEDLPFCTEVLKNAEQAVEYQSKQVEDAKDREDANEDNSK